LFPVGTLTGWWNHNELRNAMKYGVQVLKIHKTVYAEDTISPFRSFVNHFYSVRKKYKGEKNATGALFTKYILNSLYGKFGQRVRKTKFGWITEEHEGWTFEPIEAESDFGIWKKLDKDGHIEQVDARHSILCWASYVTSYARIKLYNVMMNIITRGYNIFYCDTDSILTDCAEVETGNELGQLKLERVGRCYLVAPKVYIFENQDGSRYIKIKGVTHKNIKDLKDVYYQRRIIKVKEGMRRRGVEIGQGELKKKVLRYEDKKRIWNGNVSQPVDIDQVRINEMIEERTRDWITIIKNETMTGSNITKVDDRYILFSTNRYYQEIKQKYGKVTPDTIKRYARLKAEEEIHLLSGMV